MKCVAGKSKSKKKSKKKTADLDSVFAALDQNGHADSDAAVAHDDQPEAMENGVSAADDDADDGVTSFGKKKKKGSKSKRGEPNRLHAHICLTQLSISQAALAEQLRHANRTHILHKKALRHAQRGAS